MAKKWRYLVICPFCNDMKERSNSLKYSGHFYCNPHLVYEINRVNIIIKEIESSNYKVGYVDYFQQRSSYESLLEILEKRIFSV